MSFQVNQFEGRDCSNSCQMMLINQTMKQPNWAYPFEYTIGELVTCRLLFIFDQCRVSFLIQFFGPAFADATRPSALGEGVRRTNHGGSSMSIQH